MAWTRKSAVHVARHPQLQAVPARERRQTISFYERGNRVEVSDATDTSILSLFLIYTRRLRKAGWCLIENVSCNPPSESLYQLCQRESHDLAKAVCATLMDLLPSIPGSTPNGCEVEKRLVNRVGQTETLEDDVDFGSVLVTPDLV